MMTFKKLHFEPSMQGSFVCYCFFMSYLSEFYHRIDMYFWILIYDLGLVSLPVKVRLLLRVELEM